MTPNTSNSDVEEPAAETADEPVLDAPEDAISDAPDDAISEGDDSVDAPEDTIEGGESVAEPLDDSVGADDGTQLDFSAMEMPVELAAPAPHFLRSSADLPLALDRTRPERLPIVSRKVWIAAIAVLAAVVVAVVAWMLVDASARVAVPDVTGQPLEAAQTTLEQAGLVANVTERRFSDRPVDEVLEQSPLSESVIRKGDSVSLVVSAGIEDFRMPDIVGISVMVARENLEGLGLVVVEEPLASDSVSGTVLSSTPAPGATVRSGDTVRLQVATDRTGGPSLRPYRMEGLTIVIDPAPTEEGTPDATLDVARRLRSLLEASGATVVTLRSAEATDTSDAARALIAEDAAPTAAVGLSIAETGDGGRVVTAPSGSFAVGVVAERLAQAAASQLATTAPPATRAEPPAADPVFGGLSAPWMRVQIGSAADRTDLTSFSDPRWADRVARGIYMAIGEVFGVEEDS